MTGLTINFENKPGRACGGCTLCCKLLPIAEIDKPAGQRCNHQRSGKGCAVYRQPRRFPFSCANWTCRWLSGDVADDMRRPDRVHYVIDAMPDYVTTGDHATGESHRELVVQVWIDPDYPDAHRDPALRAWLDELRAIALVRFNNEAALALFPPSRMRDGQWMEKESGMNTEPPHELADVLAVAGGAR